uniref:Replication enhancer n=1 Tax=Honeysuckle yellow vein mosaic virus TaxID=180587 RepID=Q805G8_9GEMI|nr:replication enhancer protein [Honeysuckle yellow vein mosaic virus]BAC75801.1 replication enhancer protein [Honeysuckle yellow vein mosaic virus]
MDSRTGDTITAAQAWNGAYIWTVPNPLYLKITSHAQRPFNMDQDIITIQIQFNHNLRSQLGLHKCFLTFKLWTHLQPLTSYFLNVFRERVLGYLDNLGVISINNVIRAVDHELYDVLRGTESVQQFTDIKLKLY